MTDIHAFLLGAGRSSRMGFNKLTASLAGRPVISYAAGNLRSSGIHRVTVVVDSAESPVLQSVGSGTDFVVQAYPKGTGHAVQVALEHDSAAETTVILFGDCPFIDDRTIRQAIHHHKSTRADCTVATSRLSNPWSLGIVRRDEQGRACEIASGRANLPWMSNANEIFAGLSVWSTSSLSNAIQKLPKKEYEESPDEYELPDAVGICRLAGGIVETIGIPEEQALGLNEPEQFYKAEGLIRQRKVYDLGQLDITVSGAASVQIDFEVDIGRGSVIRGPVNLHGRTRVGPNSIIGPGTTLVNCDVGADCVIGTGSWEGTSFPPRSTAADRFRTKSIYFDRDQYLIPVDPRFVFVLMPFLKTYADLFSNVIQPAVESAGYICRPGSERVGPGVITNQVWEDINRSQFIIAEISEPNPNVWYELGLAHALNKPTIMLTKRPEMLVESKSFMIRHYRILSYNPDSGDLASKLRSWLLEQGH